MLIVKSNSLSKYAVFDFECYHVWSLAAPNQVDGRRTKKKPSTLLLGAEDVGSFFGFAKGVIFLIPCEKTLCPCSNLLNFRGISISVKKMQKNHLEERLLDQAQARASYTPFFGVIRVAYPKA